ncbi:hypothetical protein [Snuella lapsa]|uniref:DUF4890 domain-containing protein n=1 Tax=Snuella lapsa TaxID=870481 RepID=A0ABP6XKD4_9FLAO
MKKFIFIAIAFVTLQITAQHRRNEGPNMRERSQKMSQLTPDEAATLQTKKMTLMLDLNESQQAEIHKINLENATKRKEMMEARKAKKDANAVEKPSKEARLKMMNAMLDHKIAMKAKMKTILNEKQYTKWETAQARMEGKRKGKMGERPKRKHN